MRIAIVMLVSGLMFGCGGGEKPAPAKKEVKGRDDQDKGSSCTKSHTKSRTEAGTTGAKASRRCGEGRRKVVTVHLTGNDAMKYNLTEINVPAGRTVS